MEHYSANRVELRVPTAGPAYLASSDVLYPGWAVTVNGSSAPYYMTNGAFRGVFLNGGVNLVVMKFWPASLSIGGLATAASFIVLLWALLKPHVGRNRTSKRLFGG